MKTVRDYNVTKRHYLGEIYEQSYAFCMNTATWKIRLRHWTFSLKSLRWVDLTAKRVDITISNMSKAMHLIWTLLLKRSDSGVEVSLKDVWDELNLKGLKDSWCVGCDKVPSWRHYLDFSKVVHFVRAQINGLRLGSFSFSFFKIWKLQLFKLINFWVEDAI